MYDSSQGMVLYKIVDGIRSSRVRDVLLRKGIDLTLEKAINICRTDETTWKQIKVISDVQIAWNFYSLRYFYLFCSHSSLFFSSHSFLFFISCLIACLHLLLHAVPSPTPLLDKSAS